MPLVVDQHANPRYLAERKQVDARVSFTGTYQTGGINMNPRDFSLSQITDVDDAIAEGYVLRWADDNLPHRIKLFGKDSVTANQAELPQGFDISQINDVRIKVWGW